MVDDMLKNKRDVYDMFNSIDEERQGFIRKNELRKFFRTKLVIPMQREEFDKLFALFDKTEDEKMEYAEFANVLVPATQKIMEAKK